MKRYENSYGDMAECKDGEFVKYEDVEPELNRLEADACDYSNWSNELYEENARLKELNREMVEVFQAIYDLSWDRFCAPTIRENCKEMIAKAGEVQGE